MSIYNIRFSQIWYKVKKPNQMELFRIHFKNELILKKMYDETKFNMFCEISLNDNKKFKNENDLKAYCQHSFNYYLEKNT